jgi:AraC-like DNA-binding protein
MECQSRSWNGITVRHVVQHLGPGRVWHDLSSKDSTVAILLDQVGGCCDARLNLNRPTPRTRFDAGHTVFVPAEMSVWGYSDGIESTRDLRLSFYPNVLTSILGDEFDDGSISEPVLMVYDDRIARCASLLAEECREPENRIYGESLTAALTALLFARWRHPRAEPAKGLAPWQLRRILEFFEAHLSGDISLRELADLVGLSQSQFARAFKTSTGTAPYRWFVAARIKRAQELLLQGRVSLAEVSTQTGFADQSHFTKAFRRLTGTSPGRWRRIRTF